MSAAFVFCVSNIYDIWWDRTLEHLYIICNPRTFDLLAKYKIHIYIYTKSNESRILFTWIDAIHEHCCCSSSICWRKLEVQSSRSERGGLSVRRVKIREYVKRKCVDVAVLLFERTKCVSSRYLLIFHNNVWIRPTTNSCFIKRRWFTHVDNNRLRFVLHRHPFIWCM